MFRKPSTLRAALFAGVSALALTVGASELRAADLVVSPRPAVKAPPPVAPLPALTIWIEGAAFWTGGGDIRVGVPDSASSDAGIPGFGVFKPRAGAEIAFGADYRLPASPWHVSFDVRFGTAKSRSQFFQTSFTTEGVTGPVTSQFQLKEREHHGVADFMVGLDVGFGKPVGLNQVKLGVRVADLEAKLHLDAQSYALVQHQACTATSTCTTIDVPAAAALSVDARSRFLGVGPRLAAEGSFPLGGPWAVDYNGGIAVLFGDRKLEISGMAVSSDAVFGFGPQPPTAIAANFSNRTGIFNADFSAALAYWFTPRAKISAGFRFDGYWKALKTFDAAGNLVDVDRFYYGPFARLTGTF